MTAVWAVSAAAGWLVLSGVVGVVVGRAVRLRDQQQPQPARHLEVVR